MTAFIVLLLITVISAVVVVTTRHIVHAAIFLAFSFLGVAGIYLLLEAPFIAASQVLIYAGAITVLILFALMLTAQTVMREPRHTRETKLAAAIVSLVLFFAVLAPNLTRTGWPVQPLPTGPPPDTLRPLARGLLNTYLFAFEVASVLLLVALVGAVVLAKEERGDASTERRSEGANE
jgi:NADH:ubiquinone oxidoreductase subunit 6 (subunit J)